MLSVDKNTASPRTGVSNGRTVMANIGMFVTATMWGLSFVSTKVLTDNGLHPVEIYLYRFIIAYLVLLSFTFKYIRSYSWRDELLFMFLGLSGGSIYFIAENIAIKETAVANVSLITTLSPLITTFLMGALYRSERPGRWIVIGSVIALIGVSLIILGGGAEAELHPIGDLLALGAAISFSVYSLVIKKINPTYSTWFITRKTFFYGILTALPFLLIEPEIAPLSTLTRAEVWGNLAFLSLVCSLGAYVFMAVAVKAIGPVKTNNYLYLQPVVTMLAGMIILSEPVAWTGWLGCFLILGGLWLGETLTRRAKRSKL